MKSVLAIRHVHFEDLGTLEAVFAARGFHVEYVDATTARLAAIDPLAPDLLVVLGGPIGAYDETVYPFVSDELKLIGARLDAGKPILGICLGAQLMARALGAKVYALGVKEIGFGPLSLSDAGIASPLAALNGVPVLHWHGDQFDIPHGGTHLASTSIGANQAFAYGPQALGLQFHLEADAARIEQWLVGHAAELGSVGIDPRVLRSQAQQHGPALARVARQVVEQWLDVVTATQTSPA
ncbi:glutamine amidotransferase [Jeongeupia chitinilytica]|uniref:GMP synthase n=1 Tax=Jeongeupia chitinilytica TaxID=1041641 RepID=A0ABQ3H3R9_9NEIS|nr:glutamine amidotransferase [Jeongeupia chitinilytica]GHD66046.1 GMP synthase [Jeongeupia chitinilytica]